MSDDRKKKALGDLFVLLLQRAFLEGAVFGYRIAMTTAGDTIRTRMQQLLEKKEITSKDSDLRNKGKIDSDLVQMVAKEHAERVSKELMQLLKDRL